MMVLEVFALLFIGFVVGLSGAIIPGPLLAYTIFDTSNQRRVTAQKIILGHALWESVIILIILLGFGGIIAQNKFIIYALGGLALALMGLGMIKSKTDEIKMNSTKVNSSFFGGIYYTAFNPTQPLWWATAGSSLLLKGVEVLGNIGVLIVTLGHWLSDFVYYIFISFMVSRNEKHLLPHRRKVSIFLGIFMIFLGIYFIIQSL